LIVDSSAIVACIEQEPAYERLYERILSEPSPGIGAPTLVETGIVLVTRVGDHALSLVGRFLIEAEAVVIPFGDQHWQVAIDAHRRYGKGRHRAGLNFGDCLTYAVAKLAGEPLLALGDDFAHTDLELA